MHADKIKANNCMITLVDSEIPSDETQHPFIIKFLKRLSANY